MTSVKVSILVFVTDAALKDGNPADKPAFKIAGRGFNSGATVPVTSNCMI
jgi:hypothetical protein